MNYSISDMRVNLLTHPIGLSNRDLRFSWTVSLVDRDVIPDSSKPYGDGLSFEIRIYKGLCPLPENLLFRSEKRKSDTFSGIGFNGLDSIIQSSGIYCWTVTLYSDNTDTRTVSDASVFSVYALSVQRPLPAFALNDGNGRPKDNTPFWFAAQSFDICPSDPEKSLSPVHIHVTARSPEEGRQFVYTLFVNGQRLFVGPPRYGTDTNGKTVLYVQTYDITPYIRVGRNTVGLIIHSPDGHGCFIARVVGFNTIGDEISLSDDDSWLCLDGTLSFRPEQSIGTHYYKAFASNIDAANYPFHCFDTNADMSGFIPCVRYDDVTSVFPGQAAEMTVSCSCYEPVLFHTREQLPDIAKIGEGHYLVDFGKEFIGGIELDVPKHEDAHFGPTEIRLYFGEQLTPVPYAPDVCHPETFVKWNMNTSNRYFETWRIIPGVRITTPDMMTLRFVELFDLPFDLQPGMIKAAEIRTSFDERQTESYFSCDRPLLNQMWEQSEHTVKVTTQDIFVDSQSRERGAYEGDAFINQMMSYTFNTNYATVRFSLEYLYTHRTWPAEYILIITEAAYRDYLATGDDASIRKYYPILKQKQFTRFFNEETGLLESGNRSNQGNDAILVDWPPSERDGYDMSVRFNTVLNCLAVVGYRALSKIAQVVGDSAYSRECDLYAERIVEAISGKLIDRQTGDVYDGIRDDGTRSSHVSQHAMAFVLYSDIVDDYELKNRIAKRIYDTSGGKIRMSIYGAYFLLMGLYNSENARIASGMLLDEDDSDGTRTWAYVLRKSVCQNPPIGATVSPEAWNTTNKPNMTFSHPWGGSPANLISSGLFGIVPTSPGYKTFDIRIRSDGINYMSIRHPTVRGPVEVDFRKKSNSDKTRQIRISLSIPYGSIARLYCDGAFIAEYDEDEHAVLSD